MPSILVVDDNPDITAAVKKTLEDRDASFQVYVSHSGKECFQVLESELVDLIILDLMMPEMSGWEVQKRLQSDVRWRHIPVIFLSAVSDDTSKRVARMSGHDFLEKPFDIDVLLKRIEVIFQ